MTRASRICPRGEEKGKRGVERTSYHSCNITPFLWSKSPTSTKYPYYVSLRRRNRSPRRIRKSRGRLVRGTVPECDEEVGDRICCTSMPGTIPGNARFDHSGNTDCLACRRDRLLPLRKSGDATRWKASD